MIDLLVSVSIGFAMTNNDTFLIYDEQILQSCAFGNLTHNLTHHYTSYIILSYYINTSTSGTMALVSLGSALFTINSTFGFLSGPMVSSANRGKRPPENKNLIHPFFKI